MTMKPFEIQSPALSINGVLIDTSAQGKLVIPGVTRAGTSVAIEVEDTGDQTYNFGSNADPSTITVIDGYQFAVLNGDVQAQVGWTAATYVADEIDGEGFIDGISVVDGGAGYTGEAVTYSQQMLATEFADPLSNFDPGVWTWIPFKVRCGAGDIESEFGSGGGATALENLEDVQLDGPSDGQVLTWNNSQEKWENRDVSGAPANLGNLSVDGDTITSSNDYIALKTGNNDSYYSYVDQNPQYVEMYVENDNEGSNQGYAWVNTSLQDGHENPEVFVEVQRSTDGQSYRWTFDKDGNLTMPGTINTSSSEYSFSSNINYISLDGSDVYVNLADGVFEGPINGRVTISGVIGMTEANGTWYYEATDPGQFRLKTDNTFSTNVDGSAWGSYSGGGTAYAGANDLNINVGQKQWLFGADGNLKLPAGGDIVDSNGTSVLGGSGAGTGNISFATTALQSPTDSNVGWSNGVISLMPGSASDSSYMNRGQYLNIYPTNAEDAPHIHIAAGMNTDGGVGQLGDLILGNDSYHVDVNGDGNIYIKTNNQSYAWSFDSNGLLSTPADNDFRMRSSGAGSTSIEYTGSVEDVTPYRTKIAASSSAATIRTSGDVNIWSFDEYGNLVLPAGGTINDSNGTNLLTQSVPDHLQNGQYAVTLANDGHLVVPGFLDLYWEGDPTVLIGTGPGGGTIGGQAGKSIAIATDNNAKTWFFNTDGSIQFPDNTIQTTAYDYAPAKLVNIDGGIASTQFDVSYAYVDCGGSARRGVLSEDTFDGEENGATQSSFDKVLNGGGA